MTRSSVRPRDTLAVVGGGQLGRMLALAGAPLGLHLRFLDPDPTCPAGHVGELIVGEYDDEAALGRLAQGAACATYEFENVPARTARWLNDHLPVFPGWHALDVCQDRLSEKTLFGELGIGTPAYAPVESIDELRAAAHGGGEAIGLPAVLKTRRLGYDGKGQFVLREPGDVDRAWRALGEPALRAGRAPGLILEAFVPFAREVSVLGVRSASGVIRFYPPVQNRHARGILARSDAPAQGLSDRQQAAYEHAARRVLEKLGYVGVLAIEFFELENGRILANEMAPRVHNSGHWTIEGAECSQFENHVRAVCGWELGSTRARSAHSVMLNIIGAEPDVPGLLAIPGAHLHMYAKSPREGRKLGHVTLCQQFIEDEESFAARVRAAESCLRNA